jgi:hypothetical protein
MLREARMVEDDIIEAVREDEFSSIIAELRERSELQDEREQVE